MVASSPRRSGSEGVVMSPVRLGDLASLLGRKVEGDEGVLVSGVASLEEARAGDLSFVRSARFEAQARESRASALILPEGLDPGGHPAIRSPSPGLDFARAARRLAPEPRVVPGVDSGARVETDTAIDPSAHVAAGAFVGSGCRVGARTEIHPNAVLYPGVVVGEDCRIGAGVVLGERSRLGSRVVLHPGVVVGADGFGFVKNEQGHFEKLPQLGEVVIDDDVEIGANATIDRGSLGPTRIRRGAKIDNMVHIAHNCDVGEDVIIAAQTGLGGSTRIERGAMLMGQVGSTGHLRVGEGAFVGTRAGLHRDVPDGARVWGSPQMDERAWHRSVAALARLPGLLGRLRAVEKRLGLRRRDASKDGEDTP